MNKREKIKELKVQLKAIHTEGARSNAEHRIRQQLRKLGFYKRPESEREHIRQGRLRCSSEVNAKRIKAIRKTYKKKRAAKRKKQQGGTNAKEK